MIQPRAALQIFLVWLLLVCNASEIHSRDNKQLEKQAQSLLALSDRQNRKNHTLALKTATRALELWKSLDNTAGIAQSLTKIARYQMAKGDLTEAKQNWEEALALWQQQNDVLEQAGTLINLGYLEQKKGEWPKAIDYYTEAQHLVGEAGPPSTLARIASGLAAVFTESGIPESALTQYQRALSYYGQAEEERAVNRMTMFIGYTYSLLNDDAAALTNLQQALARFTPGSLDAAQCFEYLAQLHLSKREYARALEHLEPSLRIYESAENSIEAARVRALIGQAYEQQGVVAGARRHYLQALQTFRNVRDLVSEAAVSFALGRLELKQGNLDEAENYLKRSIENTEEIRNFSVGRDLATAFSATVHNRYAAYVDCLMRKHKLQKSSQLDVRAFEASELARARSLAEFLRDTQTNLLAGVDPALAEEERKLRQLLRAKIDARISLLATDYDQRDLNELESSLAHLREQQQQLSDRIRNLIPSHEQITQPKIYSLAEIQTRVIEDNETALIEYILGADASYAWLVTRDSVRVFELPREEVIDLAVGKVYQLLKQRPDKENQSQLDEASAELSGVILSPLADQLHARRLIVVADGTLNYIPFQFLSNPINGEPLIAGHEIVNAPSASILGQLRQERALRSPKDKVLAAFGDPAFSRQSQPIAANREVRMTGNSADPCDLGSLLYAKQELNALKRIAGGESYFASSYAASRHTFERTDLSKFSILHLATHGIFDPERPESSGFCLSMVDADQQRLNGFMSVQDIYGLRIPVDLVVLSACRTALGKNVRGEGLIGLTRGFMHAGASSVAASLWNVDDEATAELMKNFYSNLLLHGMAPAAALRAAQNTIRQTPHWQAPYFWAAFTLQGEYKHPVTLPSRGGLSPSLPVAVIVSLILVSIVVIGWCYWRRRRFVAHSR